MVGFRRRGVNIVSVGERQPLGHIFVGAERWRYGGQGMGVFPYRPPAVLCWPSIASVTFHGWSRASKRRRLELTLAIHHFLAVGCMGGRASPTACLSFIRAHKELLAKRHGTPRGRPVRGGTGPYLDLTPLRFFHLAATPQLLRVAGPLGLVGPSQALTQALRTGGLPGPRAAAAVAAAGYAKRAHSIDSTQPYSRKNTVRQGCLVFAAHPHFGQLRPLLSLGPIFFGLLVERLTFGHGLSAARAQWQMNSSCRFANLSSSNTYHSHTF